MKKLYIILLLFLGVSVQAQNFEFDCKVPISVSLMHADGTEIQGTGQYGVVFNVTRNPRTPGSSVTVVATANVPDGSRAFARRADAPLFQPSGVFSNGVAEIRLALNSSRSEIFDIYAEDSGGQILSLTLRIATVYTYTN